jgi:type II secretory pathway component PulJ
LNQKGVTLIELLIYLVLFAIVSLLLGKQFNSLFKNYNTGKQIVQQQTDARDILGLMAREVRNTGLKIFFRSSGSSLIKDTASGTFISASDLSSFNHSESQSSTYGDTLTILMARLSATGDSAGVDTITYYLENTNLKRTLKSTGTGSTSIIAKNVLALQFQYGIYGIGTPLFSDSLTNRNNWTIVNESGTAPTQSTNSPLSLTFTSAAKGYVTYSSQRAVVKNRKYSINLQTDVSGGFPDSLDSMRFEFVNGTSLYGYEKFKPVTGTQLITVRDSISGTADMRIRYGARGAGVLNIKAVVATTAEDSCFTWVNRFTGGTPDSTSYKKYVRAIKIHILTQTNGKTGSKLSSNIQVANVSIPRPDGYSCRYFTELILVPNNGRF